MNTRHPNGLAATRGIVLAADVAGLDDLRKLSELASEFPDVLGIKIGFQLALRHGLKQSVDVVRSVSSLPVIYDHQKAGTDIPQMGRPFVAVCKDAGIRAVIIFGQAGPRTVEGFVSAASEADLVPIVGLTMSHPQYLVSEGGYISDDAPERICQLALELGVTRFVLPGNKPSIVSSLVQNSLSHVNGATIFMPGIGSQGGSLKGAFSAARPHVPVAIIGSAIYESDQPRKAITNFIDEIPK